MTMFPQVLVNVRYTSSDIDPLEDEQVKSVTAEVEAALGIVAVCCCVNPALNH